MERRGSIQRGVRLSTVMAGLWLAFLAAACVMNWAFGVGPIAAFETEFAVRTGTLLGGNILMFLLVPALPAIWVLYGAIDRAEKAARDDPARLRRQHLIIAWALLGLAGVFSIMGSVASVEAGRQPDGHEDAVPLSLAQVENETVPTRRVRLRGLTIEEDQARFEKPLKGSSIRWTYSGFRPVGSEDLPVSAPVRIIVEKQSGTGKYIPLSGDPPRETVEGYLIENGLPDHARIVLERQGMMFATPYYVLRDGEYGLRDRHLTSSLLGMIFAAIFGLVGAMVLILALRGRNRS